MLISNPCVTYCNLFIFQMKITGNLTFWLTFTENGKKCWEYVLLEWLQKGSDFSHENFQSTKFIYECFLLLLVNYWKLLCLLLEKMTRSWHLHKTSNHTIHGPQVCIIASVTQICGRIIIYIYIYIYIHHKKRRHFPPMRYKQKDEWQKKFKTDDT